MNLIDIFKAGKRPDSSGVEINITTEMLQQAVAAYDPKFHEAPFVIGHPKDNHPAYGWAKSLRLEGDVLKAEPEQVDPAFAEMVNSGRFKKISASFYLPDNPNNPKKGSLYLRHIGFLGAMPPAVKGLRTPIFNEEGDDGIVEFSQDFLSPNQEDNLMDKDKVAELEAKLAQAEQAKAKAEAEKAQMAQEKAKAEQENAQLKTEKAAAEEAQAIAQLEAVKTDNANFCEGLMNQGKLAPIAKEAALALLNYSAAMSAGRTVDFNEGENLHTLTKQFLAAQPQVLRFGEEATQARVFSQDVDVVQYGEGVSPQLIEADQKVRTYMKQHSVSYTTAFNAIFNN